MTTLATRTSVGPFVWSLIRSLFSLTFLAKVDVTLTSWVKLNGVCEARATVTNDAFTNKRRVASTRRFGAAALKSAHADVSELRHREPRGLSLLRPVPEPPRGSRA